MNTQRLFVGSLVAIALLLAVFAFSLPAPSGDVMAAGITPVGGANPVNGTTGQLVPLVTAAVTADARICKDFRNARSLDIQTVIEWAATPDTVSIKLEHSNDNSNYVDGPDIVSTVVANTDTMNRYDQFGVYTCANINVANPSSTNYPNVKMLVLPHE